MTGTPTIEIDVQTLKQYRNDGVDHVVLDVREPHEIEAMAFEGALEIPMNDVPSRIAEIPEDKTVVVLCAMGGRSMQVTMFLRQLGKDNIVNLAGGIQAWVYA